MSLNYRIQQEIKSSVKKYGHFNSAHEAYGVLKEEVDEFWSEVKTKENLTIGRTKSIIKGRMISELIQICAISKRCIQELESDQIKWV